MKRRFYLTPEAKADLREILLDVAEDIPETAERLRSEIHDALRRLGKSPGIGHYHEKVLDTHFRFWNFYSYVFCYVWDQKPIQVIAVFHGARHLASFFNTRLSS